MLLGVCEFLLSDGGRNSLGMIQIYLQFTKFASIDARIFMQEFIRGLGLKNIIKIMLALIMLGFGFVRAAESAFTNTLLKVDIHKTLQGGVKIILYTSKPYKDSLNVNARPGGEYVILLPETANALTAKPSLSSVADVLTSVDIRTQQSLAAPGQKGYTKVILYANSPIEITPQAQVLNVDDVRVSDEDFSELFAQSEKKVSPVVAAASKKPQTPTLTKQRMVKAISSPPLKTVLAKNESTLIPQTAKKTRYSHARKVSKPKLASNTATNTVSRVKKPERPAIKASSGLETAVRSQAKAKSEEKNILPSNAVEQKAQNQTQKPEKDALSVAQGDGQIEEQNSQTVEDNVAPKAADLAVLQRLAQEEKPVELSKIDKAKRFVSEHFYEVLAGLAIPVLLIILLMRGARRTIANIQEQKEIFSSNLDAETVGSKDYTQNISDDMNWREKYQAFQESQNSVQVSAQASSQSPTQSFDTQAGPIEYPSAPSEELDGLFSEDDLDDIEAAQESDFDSEIDLITGFETEQTPVSDFSASQHAVAESFAPEDFESLDDFGSLSETPLRFNQSGPDVSAAEIFGEEGESFASYETDNDVVLAGESQIFSNFDKEFSEVAPASSDIEDLFSSHDQTTGTPFEQSVLGSQPVQSEQEDEMVKSKVEIDANKGFFLVDYEGTTSLVGQIGEEIFLLKRFDNPIKGKLQARLNESKGGVSDYMVRVNSFKAIVQVAPEGMNLLIEL